MPPSPPKARISTSSAPHPVSTRWQLARCGPPVPPHRQQQAVTLSFRRLRSGATCHPAVLLLVHNRFTWSCLPRRIAHRLWSGANVCWTPIVPVACRAQGRAAGAPMTATLLFAFECGPAFAGRDALQLAERTAEVSEHRSLLAARRSAAEFVICRSRSNTLMSRMDGTGRT